MGDHLGSPGSPPTAAWEVVKPQLRGGQVACHWAGRAKGVSVCCVPVTQKMKIWYKEASLFLACSGLWFLEIQALEDT